MYVASLGDWLTHPQYKQTFAREHINDAGQKGFIVAVDVMRELSIEEKVELMLLGTFLYLFTLTSCLRLFLI